MNRNPNNVNKTKEKKKKKKAQQQKTLTQKVASSVNHYFNGTEKQPSSSSSSENPPTSGLSNLSPFSDSGSAKSFTILDENGHPMKNYTLEYLLSYVYGQIYSLKSKYGEDFKLICPAELMTLYNMQKDNYDSFYLKKNPMGANQPDIKQTLLSILSVMSSNESSYLHKKSNEEYKEMQIRTMQMDKEEREKEREKQERVRERELKEKEFELKKYTILALTVGIVAVAWTLTSIYSPVH